MFSINLQYSAFITKVGEATIKYADTRGNYYLYVVVGDTEYTCAIDKRSSDAQDFEVNYKDESTSII